LVNPYIDYDDVRIFHIDVLEEDLVWHRDKEDRTIIVLEGTGWKFQYDNDLPFELKLKDEVTIRKMVYHRLIKGKTPLRLEISRGSNDY
jgi:hypothetical protein